MIVGIRLCSSRMSDPGSVRRSGQPTVAQSGNTPLEVDIVDCWTRHASECQMAVGSEPAREMSEWFSWRSESVRKMSEWLSRQSASSGDVRVAGSAVRVPGGTQRSESARGMSEWFTRRPECQVALGSFVHVSTGVGGLRSFQDLRGAGVIWTLCWPVRWRDSCPTRTLLHCQVLCRLLL